MDKNTRIISFSKLEEGMIIAKDVEQDGKVLLKKDTSITKQMIQKMKMLYVIGNIEIYSDEEEIKVKTESKDKDNYKKIEEEFKEISLELRKTFKQLLDNNGEAINELREFSKKIQNEIQRSSLIIKNIVLYGSGTDSIYRHGVNVAALSALIGKWIGFSSNQLNLLVYAAILHDFGKTKIARELLMKEVGLTQSEFNAIKAHAEKGYMVIKEIPFLDKSVSYGVLMHHERLDGSGYPLRLKGDAIHPFAKIIAIADVFDAINSDRGYKRKKLPFESLQIVKSESLGRLDYEYTKIFLDHIIDYYTGEEVLLNTTERCKIIQMNINNLEKPLLLKDGDFIDLSKEKDLYIKEVLL